MVTLILDEHTASDQALALLSPDANIVTIDDVLRSLARRGFYLGQSSAAARIQLFAVAEELGEVARLLRRHDQGVTPLDVSALAPEAADVAIAAICLLGAAAGDEANAVLRAKLARDEARGFLHTGRTP